MRTILFKVFSTCIIVLTTNSIAAQDYLQKRSIYHDSIFLSAYYVFSIDPSIVEKELKNRASLSPRKKFKLYYCVGLRAIKDGDFDKTNRYFESALALNRRYKQPNGDLSNIAFNYFLIYQFQQKAPDLQLKQLFKADSLMLTDFEGELFGSIRQAIIESYRISGKLDKALEWIKDTEKEYAQRKTTVCELIWFVKAAVYAQLGNKTKNKAYYRKALYLLNQFAANNQRFDRPFYKGRIYTEMGACYSNLNQSEKAISYFEKALQLNIETGNTDEISVQKINLLNEESKLKHYAKVIDMGNQLLSELEGSDFQTRLSEIYINMAKAYSGIGKYKESNGFYQKHLSARENELIKEYSNQLETLEARYKTTQKEAEIIKIKQQQKQEIIRKKAAEQQRNKLVFVLVIVGVLLIVVVVFAYRFSIAKKRVEEQSVLLTTNNVQLASLIKDKEFLFKELHHRVKNNFQLVVSFLHLQEKYAVDLSVESFIRQSEVKLNAMAMVHEMLYKEHTNELIDIKAYLHNLAEYIVETMSTIDVELTVEGSTCLLPIDKAIPIGLVANEILFNSIKHTEQEELEISIRIQHFGDHLLIEMSDNGNGFHPEFNPYTSNTLGIKAIHLLMRQIGATTQWKSDNGAHWYLTIPLNSIV